MNDAFDLAIVGGGPAGSACALAAARAGLSVALFEAQSVLVDKPCGEGLMPPGVDALRALGLDDVVAAGLPFAKLRYVLPGIEPLELALPRPGLAIDRPRLTRGLEAAIAREHALARFVGHVDVEQLEESGESRGFRIATHSFSVRARTLVAADGLQGKCAAWLREGTGSGATRIRDRRTRRIGVRARFAATQPLDAVEIHFDRGTEIYLTPLSEDRINVAVLVSGPSSEPGGAAGILARALSRHPAVARQLSHQVTEPEARVLGSRPRSSVARDGAFLVGDAGGGIDPILGCGVTLALESGILAARAVREIIGGDVHGAPERRYRREHEKRTRKRRALAAVLLALSQRPLLARGTVGLVRHAPAIFGPLVSVAAGGREARRYELAG